MNKAVFFDRDGTVIEETNYIKDIKDIAVYDRVAEGLSLLKAQGYMLILVSNQSGVARGYMTTEDVEAINDELYRQLKLKGVGFDDFFYCPHYAEGVVKEYAVECGCRKPKIGMAMMAKEKYDLELSKCFMVGDKAIDMEFGKNFGARFNILVKTGYGKDEAKDSGCDYVADTVYEACRMIAEISKVRMGKTIR